MVGSANSVADIKVAKNTDSVVDTNALTIKGYFGQAINGTSFQQEAAGMKLSEPPGVNSPGITVANIPRTLGLMNTHGQAVDSQGRIHVVMWHCTDESLAAAGSRPGESRWGPAEARRNHHYWRDRKGGWHHSELPGVAGTRAKIFLDKDDNAYVVYSDSWRRGLFLPKGSLYIMAATSQAKWQDWRVIHVEEGPFVNEMLGDPYRWRKHGILSIMVQGSPDSPHEATPLGILDFTLEQQ
jgi:hypothetical protein